MEDEILSGHPVNPGYNTIYYTSELGIRQLHMWYIFNSVLFLLFIPRLFYTAGSSSSWQNHIIRGVH